jgi:predicted AlkP superfamily phosphohydrolase/phosphomutase
METNRLLIIGLDGATFEYIDPLIEKGVLPNIARLIDTGARARLRSVLHPYTAQAWTTMCTGQNAGRHGIFDFWERNFDSYSFRIPIPQRRAVPALWEYVNALGFPSVVVNVPMTYPPDPVNGVFVSGREVPGYQCEYTYPPEVKARIQDICNGRYVIVPDDWMWVKRKEPERALDSILEEIRIRFKVALELLNSSDWLFAMFVVAATDSVNHFFAKYYDTHYPDYQETASTRLKNAIALVYEVIDREIGQLLSSLPSNLNVMLVSDHGSGSESDVMIHLNGWLAEQGLLTFNESASQSALLGWAIAQVRELSEYLPYQTLTWLRSKLAKNLRSRLSQESLFSDLNWQQTKAFSEERRGNIWLNVRGRDPQGIVSSKTEYEDIVGHIKNELPKLANPMTGEHIIHHVWHRDELFKGAYVERFPDIIVEATIPDLFHRRITPGKSLPIELADKRELHRFTTSGAHRHEGILILNGPNIQPGSSFCEANLLDVCANALCLMGLPINTSLEGKLWETAFTTNVTPQYSDVGLVSDERGSSTQSATDKDNKAIEERLAGLGYLD